MLISRAVKVAVLFSLEEMKNLFDEFPGITLWNTSSVCAKEEAEVPTERFYEAYEKYLERSKRKEEYLSPYLTLGMSVDPDAIYPMDVGQGRVLIRAKKPLIQIRPYHYCIQGDKVVPMSFQKDKIFWGLEFSYPQIYAASRDAPIERIWRHPDFPNGLLFIRMLKWIYGHSELSPPARIGKSMV